MLEINDNDSNSKKNDDINLCQISNKFNIKIEKYQFFALKLGFYKKCLVFSIFMNFLHSN